LCKSLTVEFSLFAVPRKPLVRCSLPSAVEQTLDVHRQTG
jgi:hypothetical protein